MPNKIELIKQGNNAFPHRDKRSSPRINGYKYTVSDYVYTDKKSRANFEQKVKNLDYFFKVKKLDAFFQKQEENTIFRNALVNHDPKNIYSQAEMGVAGIADFITGPKKVSVNAKKYRAAKIYKEKDTQTISKLKVHQCGINTFESLSELGEYIIKSLTTFFNSIKIHALIFAVFGIFSTVLCSISNTIEMVIELFNFEKLLLFRNDPILKFKSLLLHKQIDPSVQKKMFTELKNTLLNSSVIYKKKYTIERYKKLLWLCDNYNLYTPDELQKTLLKIHLENFIDTHLKPTRKEIDQLTGKIKGYKSFSSLSKKDLTSFAIEKITGRKANHLAKKIRPWAVKKINTEIYDILSDIGSPDLNISLDALEKGHKLLQMISSQQKKAYIIQAVTFASIALTIIGAILAFIIFFLTCLPAIVSFIPLILIWIGLLGSICKYGLTRVYADSQDGKYEWKRLIPDQVQALPEKIKKIPGKIKAIGKTLQKVPTKIKAKLKLA